MDTGNRTRQVALLYNNITERIKLCTSSLGWSLYHIDLLNTNSTMNIVVHEINSDSEWRRLDHSIPITIDTLQALILIFLYRSCTYGFSIGDIG